MYFLVFHNIICIVPLVQLLFDPWMCNTESVEAQVVFPIHKLRPDRNCDLVVGVNDEGQKTREEGGLRN